MDNSDSEHIRKINLLKEEAKKKADKPGCILLLTSILISWLTVPLYLWIGSVIWNWYIITAFPTAPHLTLHLMFGVTLIHTLLFRHIDFSVYKKGGSQEYSASYFYNVSAYRIIFPGIILFFGYLFKP